MIPANPARSSSTRTFDPTSSDYHKKLHEKGYISDAQLSAIESTDKAAITEADSNVFQWQMFQSQRPLTQQQSEATSAYSLLSQRKRDEILEKDYAKEGFQFVKNKGANHNCLITAILQHLTCDYQSNHDAAAKNYRKKLNDYLKKDLNDDQKKNFLDNDLLVADHLNWLLPEMAKDTNLRIKNPTVEIWVAADEGRCVSFPIGSGIDKVIIFNRADHFEAVVPPASMEDEETDFAPMGPDGVSYSDSGSDDESEVDSSNDG